MVGRIGGQRDYYLYQRLSCVMLAAALAVVPAVGHAANAYTATLQEMLDKDPARFNDRMWDLIRENPAQKQQIFNEAVRLSLLHEIAVNPAQKVAILAKFKRLYPDLAETLDVAAGQTPTSLPSVASVSGFERPKVFANDPPRGSWWGRNWPWVALGGAAAIGGTVAIVAASSSGSSDTPPDPYAVPDRVGATQEFNNQSGLSRINAAAANNAGFTGNGITVAVVDSGVNVLHPDLRDNIAPGGYDYINNTATVTDVDTSVYHGTHVAGIIAAGKNDFGIRGVAYNAKILPLAAIGSGAPSTSVVNSVNRALSQGAKVLNGSYGPNDTAVSLFVSNGAQFFWDAALAQADAYLNAANNGMILVFAAGNSYSSTNASIAANPMGGGFLPFIRPANSGIALGSPGAYRYSNDGVTLSTLSADYSALEGKLIAAVAVDENNVIASFSNRCGVAKDWCIAAPGVNINSTSSGNSYSPLDGTSFAAPHVSGAIAVLLQQHPELTPTQVVNLLLDTATDIGATGVDDIYGHGLVNLEAAVLATGPFSIVTSSSMSGNSVLLNNSSFTSSPAFGNQLTNALAATRIGVLDSYTRNFTVGLGQRVETNLSRLDGAAALQRFGQNEFRPQIALDQDNTLSFTLKSRGGVERAGDAQLPGLASYSLTHVVDKGAAINVNYRDARANALGFNEDDRSLLTGQLSTNGIGNPYLDFVNDGYANNVTLDLPWEGRFRATTAMGAPENDDGQRNMLAMSEVGFGDERLGLSLTSGALIEQERVLGLQGTGAFALGQGTTTWFGGVAGHWQLAPKTTLFASWYGGMTDSAAADNSLVQSVNSIASSAWRLGVSRADLLQDEDRLRFNIAQPLRAESGALNVNLPQYRLRDGSIISQSASYNLAPSGREIDFEAGYSFAMDGAGKLDVAGLYRRDAGHVAGVNEVVGMTRFSRGF